MQKSNNKYWFLIDWFIHPNQFFKKLNETFIPLSNKKKTLLFLLSYLIPLICGIELYGIWNSFAIRDIASRIVPDWIVLIIFIFLPFIVLSIFMTFLPGRGIKKRINQELQSQAKSDIEKNINEYDEKSIGRIRIFSRLYLLRNNFYLLPATIIFFVMNLTNISRPWNIYYLGFYLTVTTWILILWTGYFTLTSLYSVGSEYSDIKLPKITKKQQAIKVGIGIGIYAAFVIGLTIPLNLWLGATQMPFWFKMAMFLMHGN